MPTVSSSAASADRGTAGRASDGGRHRPRPPTARLGRPSLASTGNRRDGRLTDGPPDPGRTLGWLPASETKRWRRCVAHTWHRAGAARARLRIRLHPRRFTPAASPGAAAACRRMKCCCFPPPAARCRGIRGVLHRWHCRIRCPSRWAVAASHAAYVRPRNPTADPLAGVDRASPPPSSTSTGLPRSSLGGLDFAVRRQLLSLDDTGERGVRATAHPHLEQRQDPLVRPGLTRRHSARRSHPRVRIGRSPRGRRARCHAQRHAGCHAPQKQALTWGNLRFLAFGVSGVTA